MKNMPDVIDRLALLAFFIGAPPPPVGFVTAKLRPREIRIGKYTDHLGSAPTRFAKELQEIYENWRNDPTYDLGEEPDASSAGTPYPPEARKWLRDMQKATEAYWKAKREAVAQAEIVYEEEKLTQEAAWRGTFARIMFTEWENEARKLMED